MATYFYTAGDNIPWPNNPNDAANLPPVLGDTAAAVQVGLNKRVPNTRQVLAGTGLTQTRTDLAADMTINLAVGTGLTATANDVNVNYTTLNTVYAAKAHNHTGVYEPAGDYAPLTHTHNPSQSGIKIDRVSVGSLGAGDERTITGAKLANEFVMTCVSHSSSYIVAVVSAQTSTSYSIDVRNTTQSTDHTGIYVMVLKVRDA
jgi:hypothetical protein